MNPDDKQEVLIKLSKILPSQSRRRRMDMAAMIAKALVQEGKMISNSPREISDKAYSIADQLIHGA